MTKNLDKRKYKLIQEIINMDDEVSIAKIEDQIEAIQKKITFGMRLSNQCGKL